ncbi:MAG: flavodoxin domain-containing protein, partial [Candidatus Sumerlaeota bacterium]
DITRVATEVLDAAAIAFGTPTLNRTMMPEMGALLTYLKGLRPTGKAGFSFGSYGWAKGGAKDMDAFLQDLKFDIICEPIQSKYRPDEAILEELRKAAMQLADKAREIASQ